MTYTKQFKLKPGNYELISPNINDYYVETPQYFTIELNMTIVKNYVYEWRALNVHNVELGGYHTSIDSIAYGNGIYVGLLVCNNGAKLLYYSYDLINWTFSGYQDGKFLGPVSGVAFKNGLFVYIGYDSVNNTAVNVYSTDGINWIKGNYGFSGGVQNIGSGTYIVYLPLSNRLLNGNFIVTCDNTRGWHYSTDGINWSFTSYPTTYGTTYSPSYYNGTYYFTTGWGNLITSTNLTDYNVVPRINSVEWGAIFYDNGTYYNCSSKLYSTDFSSQNLIMNYKFNNIIKTKSYYWFFTSDNTLYKSSSINSLGSLIKIYNNDIYNFVYYDGNRLIVSEPQDEAYETKKV